MTGFSALSTAVFKKVLHRELYPIMHQPEWWRREMTTKMRIQGRAGPLLTNEQREKYAASRKLLGPAFGAFARWGSMGLFAF